MFLRGFAGGLQDVRVMAPDQRRAGPGKLLGDLLLRDRWAGLILRAPMNRNSDYGACFARRMDGLRCFLDVEFPGRVKRKEGKTVQ